MKAKRPSPELIVTAAAAAWGLFWIPLRAFESQGLEPAWATLAQFVAPLIALTPLALFRLARQRPTGARQYQTGLLLGAAVALYLESLLLTEVARSLILFYAMPAWGTLLEVGLRRRPFTPWRATALVLSVAGLLVILGSRSGAATPVNLGTCWPCSPAFSSPGARCASGNCRKPRCLNRFLHSFCMALWRRWRSRCFRWRRLASRRPSPS